MEKIITRPSYLFFASRLCSLRGLLGQSPSNDRLTTVILSFVSRISSFDELIIYDSTTLCDIVTPSALIKAAGIVTSIRKESRIKDKVRGLFARKITRMSYLLKVSLEGKTEAQRDLGCKVS